MEASDRPNFFEIESGTYLVRTQAGLRKAYRHWLDQWGENDREVYPSRSSLYPSSYPSVVRFSWHYEGVTYALTLSEHVNSFRDRIARMMARLDEADPLPDEPIAKDGAIDDSIETSIAAERERCIAAFGSLEPEYAAKMLRENPDFYK